MWFSFVDDPASMVSDQRNLCPVDRTHQRLKLSARLTDEESKRIICAG